MKYKEWLSVWNIYLQMIEKRIVPKIGDCQLDDLTPIVAQRRRKDNVNIRGIRV